MKKAREAKRKQQKAAAKQPAPSPQVVMDEVNNSFESVDKERVKIAKAISSLPDNRKMHLLQMLEDAEKDLLNVSVETERGGAGAGAGAGGEGGEGTGGEGAGEEGGAGMESPEDDNYSDESDFEASAAQEEVLRPTLERIAGALTKAKAGLKGTTTNKRFPPTKRTMLGPAALLETLSRDLRLTLYSKEVELLVQHFDPVRARLLDYRDLIELAQRFTRSSEYDECLTEKEAKMKARVEAHRMEREPKDKRGVAPIEKQGLGIRGGKKMGAKHRDLLERVAAAAIKHAKKRPGKAPINPNKRGAIGASMAANKRVLLAQSDFRKRLSTAYNLKITPSEAAVLERQFNLRQDGLVDVKEWERYFKGLGDTAKARARKADNQKLFIWRAQGGGKRGTEGGG
ncbi:hypothetical protein TrRE_jg852, partial [Triparma retinervis]